MRKYYLAGIFLSFIVFLSFPANAALAANLITVVHHDGSQTAYNAAINSDVSNGNALLSAMAGAVNGDSLYLTSSTFDIGNNNIDLTLNYTGSVSIHGSGKYSTVIKSVVGINNIIIPATNSQTTDLSIINGNPAAFVGSWGDFNGPGFTNALLKNIYMSGNTDGVLIKNSGTTTATIINLTDETNWDTLNFESFGTLDIYDSSFNAHAISGSPLSGLGEGQVARTLVASNGATLNVHDSTMVVSGATLNDSIAYTSFFGGSECGTIYLYGGNFSVLTGSTALYNTCPGSGMGVLGTPYNNSQKQGKIDGLPLSATYMTGSIYNLTSNMVQGGAGQYNYTEFTSGNFADIYAYRNIAAVPGGRLYGYSSSVAVVNDIDPDPNITYKFDIGWSPTPGADGYRIYSGGGYLDVSSATLNITLGTGVENTFTNGTFTGLQTPYSLSYPSNPGITFNAPSASSISTSSVTLSSGIATNSGASATIRGFYYGESTSTGLAASSTGSFGLGAFSQTLTGLTPNTVYHYQAFAVNPSGLSTSSDATFQTATATPSVSTFITDSVTASSADLNGFITDTGGASGTVRGFIYGLTSAYGSTTTEPGNFGVGSFTTGLPSLQCNTVYHYAAYAINSAGTSTAGDSSFTTSGCPVASSPSPGVSISSGGGSISPAALAAILAPSASTTAYLYSLQVPGCPKGYVCIPTTKATTTDLFVRNLWLGSVVADVKALQVYLNTHSFTLISTGAGSPGHETGFFGQLTKTALIRFQRAYGIPATGFFGPITRTYMNGHL